MKLTKLALFAVIQSIVSVAAFSQAQISDQGAKPFDATQGSDIDSVSLTNGGVTLHVPLVSFPQRGNLDLSFFVRSTNVEWSDELVNASLCEDPNNPNPPDCIFAWRSPGTNYFGGYVISSMDYSIQQTTIVGDQFDPTLWTTFVDSPDGNGHLMGGGSGNGGFPLHSLDATGLVLLNASINSSKLLLPNGTQLVFGNSAGSPTILATDGNGNEINESPTGWTDTLGRFMPGRSTGLGTLAGTPTADLSNCPSGTSTAFVWNIPGVGSGGIRTFKFCYSSFTLQTAFQQTPFAGISGSQEATGSVTLLSAVVQPDLSLWTFAYDNYMNVSRVGLPTGGSLSYTYVVGPAGCGAGSINDSSEAALWVASRTVDANDGTGPHTWLYSRGVNTVTVTGPDGNDTVHTLGNPVSGACGTFDTQIQYYQGRASNGTLIKTVATAYSGSASSFTVGFNSIAAINVVPKQMTTTWPDGHTSTAINTYDSGVFDAGDSTTALIGSLLERDEYDFSNTLVRSTLNHYLWQDNSTYLNNNFVSLPVSTTVKDGSGCEVAKASNGYDETFNGVALQASSVTMQHVAAPGPVRGNRTSTSRSMISNCAEQSLITVHSIPYDTGEPYQAFDPLGNVTTFTYDPAYYGAYLTQTNLPDTGSGVHHIVKNAYDFNTGQTTSFTDENSQTFAYQHDNMLRLTQENDPDNGVTKFTYPDPNTVQRQRLIAGTTYDFFEAKLDGLGRTYQTQAATPDCSSNIKVDTTYDAVGRVATVSNAYCSTSDPTYGITSTQFDALSRPTQITRPDGSTILTSYTGPAVKTQDEGNGSSRSTRIAQSDALGRLVNVCEVTNATQAGANTPGACNLAIAGTGFLTTYQYDTLNNLKSVVQGAVIRSFTHDSVSRLVATNNPELGPTSYSYDNNGNLITRTRPAPNQGNPAVTVTTGYQYDHLNRATQVSFSDGVTPTVIRNYDTSGELGIVLTNTIGRLSAEYTQNNQGQVQSGRVFSYDPMGRLNNISQCTPQNCPSGTAFPIAYTYDVLGDVLSSTNGAGVTLSYTYDAAARLATITSNLQDSTHPGTLLSGLQYNALRSITASSAGSALNEAFKWDCRGRILGYASAIAPATPSLSLANTAGCPNTSAMNTAPNPFGVADPALLLASLMSPPSVSESFLLSGRAKLTQDHGLVRIAAPDSNSVPNPEEIVVPYREGETALSIAQRMAKEVNARPGSGLKATVRTLGSGAILDLTFTGNDFSARAVSPLRVSISGNRKIPSIRASSLRPPPYFAVFLGGLQATWQEGQ